MIWFAFVKMDTGEVVRCGGASMDRAMMLPEMEKDGVELFLTFPDGANEETHMMEVESLQWVERPKVAEPSANYDLTKLPSGTIVTVLDETPTVHTITQLDELLILEGPQTYKVSVDPPFPYQRIRTEVEVV